MTGQIDSLLILRKQLGDTLLLEPAISALAAHTGRPVGLIARPAFAPMISLIPDARLLPGSWAPRGLSHLVSFDPRARSALTALLAGARQPRLVVSSARHLRWWHRPAYAGHCDEVRNPDRYWARYYFEQVPRDEDAVFRPPRLRTPPADWRHRDLPADYLVLHPTSAWRRKCWPAQRWVEVCRVLLGQAPLPLVLSSGPADWEVEYCSGIAARLPAGSTVLMSGRTSLPQYLALLAGARLVLTVDGSASHLAAAFDTPVLSVFGPTRPAHWHHPSETSVCVWAGDYSDAKKPPVDAIPVEAVVEGTRRLLPGALA